jgi:hypothetical protein
MHVECCRKLLLQFDIRKGMWELRIVKAAGIVHPRFQVRSILTSASKSNGAEDVEFPRAGTQSHFRHAAIC